MRSGLRGAFEGGFEAFDLGERGYRCDALESSPRALELLAAAFGDRDDVHAHATPGDDWAGRFDDLSAHCEVVYVPRTKDVSSTEIRQLVHALHQERTRELRQSVQHVLDLVERL